MAEPRRPPPPRDGIAHPLATAFDTIEMNALKKAVTILALGGTIALFVAITLTVVDIVLRNTSSDTVFGIIDIVQLCVLVAAMLAIPYGFVTRTHVSVDIFYDVLPGGVRRILRAISLLLSTLFLGGVFWFSTVQMLSEYRFGDRSFTLGISMIWFWLPFLIGIGLAVATTLVLFIRELVAPGEIPPADGVIQ